MFELFFSALVACASAPPSAVAAATPKLEPLEATSRTDVEVPGAPAGCVAKLRVRVDAAPCATLGAALEPGPGGWNRLPGTLQGTAGYCVFMCRKDGSAAQWLVDSTEPGWRGTATCAHPALGSMTMRATPPAPGGAIDPAVGALWLEAGATSWGFAPLPGGDGYGVTEHGCPAGQPSR